MARNAQVATIPAPVGGWNARDPITAMPPGDAVTLDNWWPDTSVISVRKGYQSHVTGLPGNVESLMVYNGTTMFAASGTGFYNVTTPGAVGAAVQTGLTNARWQYVNFVTTGGVAYLVCVNGVDSMRAWNGTAWTTITGASSPAITGITTSDISNVTSHKNRLWFVRKNSLEAWYQVTGALGGLAALFDLRPVFRFGGTLQAIVPWTLDAGAGMDDYLAFISDQGEIAVYQGTDPSSSNTWSLRGVYNVGRPVGGGRCAIKWGGDVLMIGREGLLALSSALMSSQINKTNESGVLTDKIQQAISLATGSYSNNFGWQIVPYPEANMLFINIPVTSTIAYQYAMNTITGAWARFLNQNAYCWVDLNDSLYFGGANVVYKAWTGANDNNANIDANVQTAYTYFDAPGVNKFYKMARPIFQSNASTIQYQIALSTDFDVNSAAAAPTNAISFSIWNSGQWGAGVWSSSSINTQKTWQGVGGIGYSASVLIKTATQNVSLNLASVDIAMEPSKGVL